MVLSAEAKMNMSLDDIIKIEKPIAGVSRVLTPSFRRHMRSQQWRLRGNGPGTPIYRAFGWSRMRPEPLSAFLARKARYAGPTSVFHRLGWTAQGVAHYKLRQAKYRLYWRRRQRQQQYRSVRTSGLRGHQPFPFMGPQRAQAVYNRIMEARQQNYTGPWSQSVPSVKNQSPEEPIRLTQVALSDLAKALGGHITSVKEDVSPEGSVITTITRRSTPSVYSTGRTSCASRPSVRRLPHLNPYLQRTIACIQEKPYKPLSSALYSPDLPKGVGVGDFRPTPSVTSISTDRRFSGSAMEVDA